MKPTRLLLLILFLCPVALYAQNASVGGSVQDPSGAVVPKASVEFRNQDTGIRRQAASNGSGYYQIEGIDPGKYDATVQANGFKTITREGVVFHVGDQLRIDFKMQLGESTEHVEVDGSGEQINTTDGSVSTVIDRKFVENIPLNGRSFQDLISLTPGVVTQSPQTTTATVGKAGDFSVNGQRTESNYYTVDGVSANISAGNGGGVYGPATGGSLGGSTALGTTQTLIPVDALQEFRVQSSSYSAGYGTSPGGQFSLVSRSGTNALHGALFDYLRNNFFDANDWFNDHYGKPTPALRQNDFGGTLGGPVLIPHVYDGKDRSFFFVAYEGLRLVQPTEAAIQYVPDLSLRQQANAAIQPILNAFPLPNGIDYGNASSPSLAQFIAPFSLPSSIDSTSVRFDHTLNSKLALFFRFGDTLSSTQSRPYFARQTTTANAQTYTLGATSQFSSSFTNEFRLGYAQTSSAETSAVDNFGGATPTNLAADVGAGSIQHVLPIVDLLYPSIGSSEIAAYDTQDQGRQWNLIDTLQLIGHNHSISLGFDYRRVVSPLTPPNVEPFALFESSSQVLAGKPLVPYVFRFLPATPVFDEGAVFVQDEWRVHPRLNLSLGVRWEVDPPPTEEHGDDAYTLLGNINVPSSLSVAPQGTPLWKTTWYNFAPRLGAAWIIRNQPGWQTVLRSGGGVFFDTLAQIATIGYDDLGFHATRIASGATIPFTPSQLNVPVTVNPPYTSSVIAAFPEHLQLPYTLEWNVSLQQGVGSNQSFTLSYVGSNGRRLIGLQEKSLTALNPNFGTIEYFADSITSNYQSLQAQYQRSVTKGVQALASYTWSHAIDFGSNATELTLQRGNSDFDVRENFQAGLSWELPKPATQPIIAAVVNGWALDGRLITRTPFPVTLGGNTVVDPNTGSEYAGGLNLVPGAPVYLHGSQFAGGKAINPAAFSIPATGAGNAPRNFVRGFGESQLNFAARREIHLSGPFALQFRAETFNLLNHPNFGYVDPTYSDATFGQATQSLNASLGTIASQYQQGGARSMQFALKLTF